MLNLYFVANIFGRFLVSYLTITLIGIVFSKGDWRTGVKCAYSWYGTVAVSMVFFVGLFGSIAKGFV